VFEAALNEVGATDGPSQLAHDYLHTVERLGLT
jgi:hypothetical protein